MRTLSVPWRISKHERFALRHWPSWSLGVVAVLAVAALVLALLVAR
jgi:hypothetical protein